MHSVLALTPRPRSRSPGPAGHADAVTRADAPEPAPLPEPRPRLGHPLGREGVTRRKGTGGPACPFFLSVLPETSTEGTGRRGTVRMEE